MFIKHVMEPYIKYEHVVAIVCCRVWSLVTTRYAGFISNGDAIQEFTALKSVYRSNDGSRCPSDILPIAWALGLDFGFRIYRNFLEREILLH